VPPRVDVGLPAPAYHALALNGDSVSLAGLRDKVVLLNVWATWCHPCRTEIPELRAIHAKYAARGLELVGVSVDADGNDEGIREFMREFRMTYPVWRDPGERVSAQFLVLGVPATFLIDRGGVLRWRKTGPVAPNDTSLTAAIERAIGG
jgi:cytochrome c biogenesis protein CcmG, thiol:disulfide interchange protein DsbE